MTAGDDFDQSEQLGKGGPPDTSAPVVEGAQAELDTLLEKRAQLRQQLDRVDDDLAEGIEAELVTLGERTFKLQGTLAAIRGEKPPLRVADTHAPELRGLAPSTLHRADGSTTTLDDEGHGADGQDAVVAPGKKGRARARPGPLPPFDGTKVRTRAGVAKGARVAQKSTGLSVAARILAHLAAHPGSSNPETANALGVPLQVVSTTTNALKRGKKVKRAGKGKRVTWSLV